LTDRLSRTSAGHQPFDRELDAAKRPLLLRRSGRQFLRRELDAVKRLFVILRCAVRQIDPHAACHTSCGVSRASCRSCSQTDPAASAGQTLCRSCGQTHTVPARQLGPVQVLRPDRQILHQPDGPCAGPAVRQTDPASAGRTLCRSCGQTDRSCVSRTDLVQVLLPHWDLKRRAGR
jgi:hypothetical protein